MKLTVEIEVPENYSGAFQQLVSRYSPGSKAGSVVVAQSLIFALRRVMEGVALKDDFLETLEENNNASRSIISQASGLFRIMEMSAADALALQRSIVAMI